MLFDVLTFMFQTPMDKQTVNGYKLVKVCEDNDSGNYSCCNAAKKCQSLTMEVFRGKDLNF